MVTRLDSADPTLDTIAAKLATVVPRTGTEKRCRMSSSQPFPGVEFRAASQPR